MSNYKHWDVKEDNDKIVWLGLNRKNAEINTINDEVLDELNSLLQEISKTTEWRGLVLYSLKSKGFIAGADINRIASLRSPNEVMDFLRKGQTVFSRLEEMNIPTVAMIDGFCMGGGMELALACDYRVASDDKQTRLGLPEVLLGIHPGWGGMVRLPRLIGGFKALTQMILTGSALSAERAKKIGLVDEVVPKRQLKRTVAHFILNKPAKHEASFIEWLSNQSMIRPLIAKLLRYKVNQKVRSNHYPAPSAIIDLWEKDYRDDERAYLKEADSVKALAQSETTANLIRVFFLRERLKGLGKESHFKAKHVHVIGAGVMGGDIAAWCAFQGLKVTLQDQSYEKIAPAITRAHTLYLKKLKKPRLVQFAMDRLIPDPEGYGIAKADVIIEAVFENLTVKQNLMKTVEAKAKLDAIIATNTSSIPLEQISSVLNDPGRLVGIHFFNPVAKMELVEVVSAPATHETICEQAISFVHQIQRLPLPVKSSPGFLVNRVLMPYLMECVRLLEDGYAPEVIDEAALSFGMMMGPVELADTVGMDVCLAVAENLTSYFGGEVPQTLKDKVASGKLGRKTGEGFYRYKQGKPQKEKVTDTKELEVIADRLISSMVNEAALCLKEGVVADADLLDAGMIFGTGFAPFRGGPMHYAKTSGSVKYKELCEHLKEEVGDRFQENESFA